MSLLHRKVVMHFNCSSVQKYMYQYINHYNYVMASHLPYTVIPNTTGNAIGGASKHAGSVSAWLPLGSRKQGSVIVTNHATYASTRPNSGPPQGM